MAKESSILGQHSVECSSPLRILDNKEKYGIQRQKFGQTT
jgi:hypothetical protein